MVNFWPNFWPQNLGSKMIKNRPFLAILTKTSKSGQNHQKSSFLPKSKKTKKVSKIDQKKDQKMVIFGVKKIRQKKWSFLGSAKKSRFTYICPSRGSKKGSKTVFLPDFRKNFTGGGWQNFFLRLFFLTVFWEEHCPNRKKRAYFWSNLEKGPKNPPFWGV